MSKAQEAEKTEFTIEEAAEYLGKSIRTVERMNLSYTKQFRRGKDYIDREVRIFSKSVLDEAKKPKESVKHIPGIMKSENQNQTVTREDLKDFAAFLITGIKSEVKQLAPAQKPKKEVILADLAVKGILTMKEALKYSGLTKAELTEALEAKKVLGKSTERTIKLKGQDVVSHIWKINRQSLDKFLENYGS